MVMRPDVPSKLARHAQGLTYFNPPQASTVSLAAFAERKPKAAGVGEGEPPIFWNSDRGMQIFLLGSSGNFSVAMVYSLPSESVQEPHLQQISLSSGGVSLDEEELLMLDDELLLELDDELLLELDDELLLELDDELLLFEDENDSDEEDDDESSPELEEEISPPPEEVLQSYPSFEELLDDDGAKPESSS